MQKSAIILLNFSDRGLVEFISDLIHNNFDLNTEIITADISSELFYDISRKQYYSTKILEYFLKKYGKTFYKIIVLTEHDLYVPVLSFIFGEAQLNGTIAIASSHRLYQEFYGLQPNDELLYQRFGKEVLHELGHTYGLKHCIDWNCVMHASSSVDEIDIKGNKFCTMCLERINIIQ